ncbi:MAG: RNA 3'-phosphate cyclase [Candidatus Methanomethylicota archaeon]|uniref:RNA 3'-terminal phosphate cyclase n=1 Tax=Thermoproteota archaeon TaxID=2056631 RepID=A0A497F3J7_9CREN|nr:MAG: RNA 3'-phosphate cyclase [Candidatus Verstraetearchaeota archaeon]
MLVVDGSIGSGSGTVLRLAVATAAILGEELRLFNIRAKRKPPGLRPQHLKSVLTAAKICDGHVEAASIGSRELYFKPGRIKGGRYEVEIGTAGSIPMLFLTVLPICALAEKPVEVHVRKGGTDVHRSPTINYMKYVLLPVLSRLGVHATIEVKQYGYYPKGMGEAILKVNSPAKFNSINFTERGEIKDISGVSVCTYLKERKVAERQAKAAAKMLNEAGFEKVDISVIYDFSNKLQKGSSIVLWADAKCDSRIGADAIGALGKLSEVVGEEAARKLLAELNSNATVDVHLGDMLILYIALAKGSSSYLVRSITEHISTNIKLCEVILGVNFKVKRVGKLFEIVKL